MEQTKDGKAMTRVKGQGILIGRVAGKAGKPMQEPIEEWSDETPDSQQLRRALIEAHEKEQGAITEEELASIRAQWPD